MAIKYKTPKRPSFGQEKARRDRAAKRQVAREGRSDLEQLELLKTRPGNSAAERAKICKRTEGPCFCGSHRSECSEDL